MEQAEIRRNVDASHSLREVNGTGSGFNSVCVIEDIETLILCVVLKLI